MLLEQSVEKHGSRIGLFSRATARTPNLQWAIIFSAFSYQLRKDPFFKHIPAFLLAKEVRLPDSKVTSKYFDLSVGKGSGKEVPDSRFTVARVKLWRGSRNCALEVVPALFRIVQSHLDRYQIT